MARNMITFTGEGLRGWIDEVDREAAYIPDIMLRALSDKLLFIEPYIRSEWVSRGGESGGFVYESVGHSVEFSKANRRDVVGTVGVYDMDSIRGWFNKTPKDLNAPQIAYWVENGTYRVRTTKNEDGTETDELVMKIQPQPFITRAVLRSWSDAESAFVESFNEQCDQLL